MGEGAGQCHTLLLAAGELVGTNIGLIQDADLIEGLQGLHFILPAENTQQYPPEWHIRYAGGENIFDDGGAGDQIERLEHHADAPAEAAQAFAGKGADIDAIYHKGAGGDAVHPVDGAQQGGFTGTGTADDGDKFTILDGQVYIVQPHGAIGVYLGYMVKLNHTVSSSAVRIQVSFINRDTHAGGCIPVWEREWGGPHRGKQ